MIWQGAPSQKTGLFGKWRTTSYVGHAGNDDHDGNNKLAKLGDAIA